MNDWELLDRYTRTRCELAFGELVTRHAGFIHGTCRRVLRDAHRAQDVMQAVFVVLARRPPVRRAGASLAGWLYQTAIYACNNAMRSERRRVKHERQAIEEREREMAQSESSSMSTEIETQLDDALATLSSTDRDVLLMRYYQDFDLKQIGAALGLSETAASKRATRALDRLRAAFAQTGQTLPAGALCAMLRQPATGQLIHDAASAALTGNSGVVVESISQGVIKMMSKVKAKLVAACAATAIVVFGGAAMSVSLLFAQAPQMAPQTLALAAPATQPAAQPASQPGDVSAIKETLTSFAKATRGADFETLARVSKMNAGDDIENALIVSANQYQQAMGDLFTAIRDKFGEAELRKFARQRGAIPLEPFLRLIEAELDHHDVVVVGDAATLVDRRDAKTETHVKLVREEGVWKVASSGLAAQFGNDTATKRIEMLTIRAGILREVAEEVTTGKYENIDAVGSGLKAALQRR